MAASWSTDPVAPLRSTDEHAYAVRLRDVAKTYREGETIHRVLDGVDLTVSAGEYVALLGPSGSGKSTLLNLVGGIDVPTAGRVEVAGAGIEEMTEHERTLFRRRHIGLVFQFFNLIPTLTVEENLHLPLELAGELDDRSRARAADLLARVGMGGRARSFPDRLSGGEQQRVAIVRALVTSPAVVLADEPTGNLDQETGGRVLDLLLGLLRERGSALLIVSHNRAVAARADRALELRNGKVATTGAGVES